MNRSLQEGWQHVNKIIRGTILETEVDLKSCAYARGLFASLAKKKAKTHLASVIQ